MCLALRLWHCGCLLYQTHGETHFFVKDTTCLIDVRDVKLLTALSQRDANGFCGCTSNFTSPPTGLKEQTPGEIILSVRARAFLTQPWPTIPVEPTVRFRMKLTVCSEMAFIDFSKILKSVNMFSVNKVEEAVMINSVIRVINSGRMVVHKATTRDHWYSWTLCIPQAWKKAGKKDLEWLHQRRN